MVSRVEFLRGLWGGRPLCPPGDRRALCHYVIWWGASSISMRKVSIGVSPMSLKKNRCSKHFSPMERRAGSRSNSLANLLTKTQIVKRWKNKTDIQLNWAELFYLYLIQLWQPLKSDKTWEAMKCSYLKYHLHLTNIYIYVGVWCHPGTAMVHKVRKWFLYLPGCSGYFCLQ